jgi:uncharacterized membrane protein (UPF0127 family)
MHGGPNPRRRSWRAHLNAGALVLAACGDSGPDVPSGGFDLSDSDHGEISPSGRTVLEGFTEVTVVVTAVDGTTEEFCLLLADEQAEWARGLMEVIDLGDYPGMVFEFPEDRTGAFFMRNTPTPLTIAYVDSEGSVVSTADMDPCEDRDGCPTYAADGPYRLAVEVPQGNLASIGLDEAGTVLELAGACAPL